MISRFQPELQIPHSGQEAFLGDIASAYVGEAVSVVYFMKDQTLPDAHWYYFTTTKGTGLAVGFQMYGQELSQTSYYRGAISLAHKIASQSLQGQWNSLLQVAPIANPKPLLVESFHVVKGDRLFGTVHLAHFAKTTPFARASSLSTTDFVAKQSRASLPFSLHCVLPKPLRLATGEVFEITKYECELRIQSMNKICRCSCLVDKDAAMISLQVLEKTMENEDNQEIADSEQDQKLSIKLCLGTVELSLGELLQLRPGSEIALDKPEVFKGTLEVEGAIFAEADITLTDQSAQIRITSLTALNNSVKKSH